MGVVSDVADEFKQLPPAGKVAALGAGAALLVLIVYEARQRAAANALANSTLGSGATDPNSTAGLGTVQPGGDLASPVIEQELQAILTQLQAQAVSTASSGTPAPTPTPTPTPTPPNPIKSPGNPGFFHLPVRPRPTPAPAQQPRYDIVAQWLPVNSPWNSTLSGIASHEGESLSFVERLNPTITNPNLIHPGQQIRVQ